MITQEASSETGSRPRGKVFAGLIRLLIGSDSSLPGGLPLRVWHIYVFVWLGCLAFPIASLVRLRPPLSQTAVAAAGLISFAAFYVWFMRGHPINAAPISDRTASLVLFAILFVTLMGLTFSVALDSAFLWLFVGAGIVAGRTLPTRSAHLVATVLPLLAVAMGLALSNTASGTDWLHIFPLALLIRAMGLNMIGLAVQSGAIRDLNRAREELARRAVSEERLRMARDLHDLLGHTLSLIVLKSELAGRLVEKGPARAADEIHDLEGVARQALREVRQAVAGYRQPTLTSELDGAQQMLKAAGVVCSVENKAGPIPAAIDAVLAWAVREGVTNVIRHSHAHRCIIRITQDSDVFRAEIINDGISEQADALIEMGSGLSGLTERVSALGGSIQTGPYLTKEIEGFCLMAEIPISNVLS